MKMERDDVRKRDEEDQKNFNKGYKEAFGIWMKFGGMFSGNYHSRGSVWLTVAYLTSTCLSIPLLFVTVIKTRKTDLTIAFENIHFIIFVSVEVTGVLVFNMKRKSIINIYTLLGSGFYDYEDTLDEACLEFVAEVNRKAKIRKRFVHDSFVSVVMSACFAITILRPIIKLISGEQDLGGPDDGIITITPVPLWSPINESQWYAYLANYLLEYIIAFTTPGIVMGGTFFIVFSLEELSTQLQLLGLSLRRVLERAERLNHLPLDDSIRLCLRTSIKHHQLLFKFKDEIESMISMPLFSVFLGFTIMMCMSGYIFILKEVPIVSKLVFGLFLLSEAIMLFTICYYGEEIQQLSEDVGDMLYQTNWIDHSKLMKSYMIIIQIRSRRNMRIELAGFMDISRQTFSSISSTSYSYFNLMLEFN